mmetsp:Transcript_12611/g.12247  ORF Transcript_12611/g.12247 Transcript_12611/m.12247 type:complete len:129 (+) Transcript_12611:139-525(+)|eukprot:CAMPEP_0119052586 /NCGR_PEP_ID=MMETSP1177-20130426/73839_1 /TAXON_ID=2985 /ORGANISM="Ochromonas sp, Strain CCMP1899" /LENGTH=128 /DNA_ID=CAMNT_0007032211 /DNA_START=44 /DNA_END=430 /DNA_ORIENTATION=-
MSLSTKPDDVEVRHEDQEKINEFGRLNNRLLEVSAELKQSKEDNDKLEDASAELMMTTDSEGKVMLLIGEAFIQTSEEDATEYCEGKQLVLSGTIDKLAEEEKSILQRQVTLKKELYGRFGDSINLES